MYKVETSEAAQIKLVCGNRMPGSLVHHLNRQMSTMYNLQFAKTNFEDSGTPLQNTKHF